MTLKMPPILLLALVTLCGAHGCSDPEAPTCSSTECSSSSFVVSPDSIYAKLIEGSVPSDSDISSTDKKRWEVRFSNEDKTQLIIIRSYHQEDGLPLGPSTYDLNCTRPEECAFCVTMLTDCDNGDLSAGVGCKAYYANTGSATVTAMPSQEQGSFIGSLNGLQFRELTSGDSLRDDESTPGFCFANTIEFSATVTDLCEDSLCDPPASPTCFDETTVQTSSDGICNPQTGICEYELTDTPCENGQVCSEGACVDPGPTCDDSVCPGVAECSGPFEIYTTGLCDETTGECSASTTTACTDGEHCQAGACTADYEGEFSAFAELEPLTNLICGELTKTLGSSVSGPSYLSTHWQQFDSQDNDDDGYLEVSRWYTDNWLSHTQSYELSGSDPTNGGEFQVRLRIMNQSSAEVEYLAVGGTVSIVYSNSCQSNPPGAQQACSPFGDCTQLVYTFTDLIFVESTSGVAGDGQWGVTPNPDGNWLRFNGQNVLTAQGTDPNGNNFNE